MIGNPESLAEESHAAGQDRLLEYPLYTKPPSWRGLDVPEVLFSGHHAQIAAWRRERAVELTRDRRPDLLSDAERTVVIEAATQADAGEILTLQRAAYVPEGRMHDSFDMPPLTDDLAATERIVESSTGLVARRNGRLVGFVFGALQHDRDWFIGRLMVAPDLQGAGLGRRLLAEIESAAPPEAVRSVLVTGSESAANQAFYARHGFRVVSEDVRGSVPIVVMERPRTVEASGDDHEKWSLDGS